VSKPTHGVTGKLGKLGYRVLHLPGQLVQGNMAGAIALVRAALGH